MLQVEPSASSAGDAGNGKLGRRARRALGFENAFAPLTGTRRRIAPSLRRKSRHKDREQQPVLTIEGGNMVVTTPGRLASSSPQDIPRQVSPDFLVTTRPPPPGSNTTNQPQPEQQQQQAAAASEPLGLVLPPIGRGVPSRSSPSTSRQKQALSPYASAPQGLIERPPAQMRAARSPGVPISPTARYRVSPRSSPPLMVHSSPSSLEAHPANQLISKRLAGNRSRGLDINGSAQRLTLDIYARITSPAKLHHHEPSKRSKKAPQPSLPPAFALAKVKSKAAANMRANMGPIPPPPPPPVIGSTDVLGKPLASIPVGKQVAAPPPRAPEIEALIAPPPDEASSSSSFDLATPPPLKRILEVALPEGAVGSLQQQADACMMLLRADWKAKDAADTVQTRTHAALHFIRVLYHHAEGLSVLKGTLFQALMAQHTAMLQRKREEEERRLAAQEQAEAAAAAAADGASQSEIVPAPAADGDEAARLMLRSRGGDGSSDAPPLAECLQTLAPPLIEALGMAGAELRGLLRIKIEDDQDLKTAERALAECGYFLLLLREEAPKRELSHQQLLKKLDLGEG